MKRYWRVMAGSWSPYRTEARARKGLQDAQQSAEPEKMEGMRRPKMRTALSCLKQQGGKSCAHSKHTLVMAAFFKDLRVEGLHNLAGHSEMTVKGATICLELQVSKCFKKIKKNTKKKSG